MSFDNAYEAIVEDNDELRWAYGTGPEEAGLFPVSPGGDPLAGVDRSVPSGVDSAEVTTYCLMLGDDALIFSHRLQQWCTNAPELEDEVALANIGLDLLGQARLLLSRPGEHSEDDYAYFRGEHEFRNVRLAELPRGDFGELVARLLVFSTWRLALFARLVSSRDTVLSAIAEKGVKELTYHRDYAAQWTVRLGDGTEFSRERMRAGLATVWPYVDELFRPHETEAALAEAGVGVNPAELREEFDAVLAQVLGAATLDVPDVPGIRGVGGFRGIPGKMGRDGVHTEAMGYLLAELQSVARADPEAIW